MKWKRSKDRNSYTLEGTSLTIRRDGTGWSLDLDGEVIRRSQLQTVQRIAAEHVRVTKKPEPEQTLEFEAVDPGEPAAGLWGWGTSVTISFSHAAIPDDLLKDFADDFAKLLASYLDGPRVYTPDEVKEMREAEEAEARDYSEEKA